MIEYKKRDQSAHTVFQEFEPKVPSTESGFIQIRSIDRTQIKPPMQLPIAESSSLRWGIACIGLPSSISYFEDIFKNSVDGQLELGCVTIQNTCVTKL